MNVIDVVERVVGDSLTPEVLQYLRTAPNDVYDRLHLEHRTWEKKYVLPELPRGEIRPYVPLERGDPRISGITLPYFSRSTGIGGIEGNEMATDSLVQHLLFCHSIAIDCPLAYLLDYFGPGMKPSHAAMHKVRITDFLHFACSIRPLVDQGIVHFVESWPVKSTNSPRGQILKHNLFSPDMINSVAANADWSDMEDIFPANKLAMKFRENYLVSNVVDDFELTLNKSHVLAGNYSMYLPKKCYQALFAELVKSAEREIRKITAHDDDKLIMADLINIDMPHINDLSIVDLVSIRSNEEVFEEWRTVLRRALAEKSKIRIEDALAGNTHANGMQDVMDDARRKLSSRLGTANSRIRINSRQATKGFFIKALGMSVLMPDRIKEAIIAGLVHSGLEYVWSHLTAHNTQSSAEQSFQRHIVAASPGTISRQN